MNNFGNKAKAANAKLDAPAPYHARPDERGAALAMALIILALLAVIAMSVLAVASSEIRIAGSDLQRTQTFYASAAAMEKMTSDLSDLFSRTSHPTAAQLARIQNSPPPELVAMGFNFDQQLSLDDTALAAMRRSQGITNGSFPFVNIRNGPYAGLSATISPYLMTSTGTQTATNAQVTLQRQVNSYLIPLFQFGMFSDEDIELHPGPAFTFNGRVHANGNIYVNGNVTFLSKVTTANEFVTDVFRNGSPKTPSTISMQVGSVNSPITMGSVVDGPNFNGSTSGQRGFFPDSPLGFANTNWAGISVAAAQAGFANQFGGQLLTRTTGAVPLLLPMQLGGSPTREIIKRSMPNDRQIVSQSRYHNKAQIRILLDDESTPVADASGIPAGQGVWLSNFVPASLPEGVAPNDGGGRALWRINNNGTYLDTNATAIKQGDAAGARADTVRGIKAMPAPPPAPSPTPEPDKSASGVSIPWGAGIQGRILIQIVDADGNFYDVTRQVLSLGMTEGEPNGIVYLQRPLWAAFTHGSRDAGGGNNSLTFFTGGNGAAPNINGTNVGISGSINTASVVQNGSYGYLTNLSENTAQGAGVRADNPGAAGDWNSIVPINVYNVREGRINTNPLTGNLIYERGMTSVVEINMRNLTRWVDGVFDTNLLLGTNAVSTNIDGSSGYIVYVSDRRGDNVRPEIDAAGSLLTTTNGLADNEDIYGPNNTLDPGEDVIDDGLDTSVNLSKNGSMQKDTSEVPDPDQGSAGFPLAVSSTREARARAVAAWSNPNNYFRRAVRLFNAEDLQTTGALPKLSLTKGITVATENLVYTWGNFNTTGINGQPPGASTLNDPAQAFFYLGNQVPASIVADAFFPLSKTWFDGLSAMYPDDLGKRVADANLPSVGAETSVRAGIIAGNNLSALGGNPDAGNSSVGESRLNGGMHNFPRFLEHWNNGRWNFVGALIPLYHSTQALGPYNSNSTIYSPPTRNWAFDVSFTDPRRLPPGTPSFEYIMPTGFRQIF